MSSTKIYHNISRLPIVSTVVLIWGNYEIYRIHKGTHPYWSPRLEAAGIVRGGEKTSLESPKQNAKDAGVEGADAGGVGGVSIRWTNLNGVPIPTLDGLIKPFRND
jgi:hypothetical protein